MAPDYPEWQWLRDILVRIQAEGFARLSADEIIEFGKWYRRAAVELSYQRTRDADPARIAFLNALVGQCYAHVYVAPRHPWPSVLRFFAADFPRAFRKHGVWMALAATLLFLPAIIAFLITWHDKTLAAQLFPQFIDAIDELVKRHHTPHDWLPALQRIPSFSMIATNNIKISILAFAGGMSAGVITVPALVFNGVMLGVVTAGVAIDGSSTAINCWAFLLPHGVIELSAIYIAGGAGLVLAYALINPGVYPRRVALRIAGKDALQLIMGVVAMLVVAATVESFFSPLDIREPIKFSVAGALFVLLYTYLAFAGRHAKDEQKAAHEQLMTPLPPV